MASIMSGTVFVTVPSPVGPLFLAEDGVGLRLIEFVRPRYPEPRGRDWQRGRTPLLTETRRQLEAYFAGRLRMFDVPLNPRGSEFQQRVWRSLREIPYGRTCSYGDIARRLRDPAGARAVGAANGRNPIPIIVPCHRVIGADGSLTGYGGGLAIKRYLLRLEGADVEAPSLFPA